MSTALLLTHLQNTNPNVPFPTLIAALSHHLAVDQPSPTPLAAAAVSSPFFVAYPQTHERLQGLVNAFRHAVHLKRKALAKDSEEGWSFSKAIFSKSVEAGVREWVRGVLRGLQGGQAVIRLACCVGLLLGVKQLGETGVSFAQVEDEVVIALAEVVDDYSIEVGEWEKEFWPYVDETSLSLALIIASQGLPLIPTTKLKALPFSLLARFLTATISSAFRQGNFISSPPESKHGPISIPPSSLFAETVEKMTSSPAILSMAGLSRLTAVVVEMIIDSPSGLREVNEILQTFKDIASNVERNWMGSRLSSVQSEDDIAPDTRELSKSIWLLLKTLLFSAIVVAEGALESLVYSRPRRQPQSGAPSINSYTISQTVLQTLFHLSFVISQFGGVTTTSNDDNPGLSKLRKVFYLALDVLSSGHQSSTEKEQQGRIELFLREFIDDLSATNAADRPNAGPFNQAKTAYTLACIEQLVPSLRVPFITDYVWATCDPYLSDPSHRETYESAHSVVLSIFASHAQQHQPGHLLKFGLPVKLNDRQIYQPATEYESRHSGRPNYEVTGKRNMAEAAPADPPAFVHRMVPYYAQCLIENSRDGKLSTTQLRLAYAALVRSACTSPNATGNLGWYCITLLLDMINQLSPTELGARDMAEGQTRERLHRLHLTLISTVSSLPLPLMIRALEKIRSIVMTRPKSDGGVWEVGDDVGEERRRKELVDALFVEILEGVGDREKEAAMRWWYANRMDFGCDPDDATVTFTGEKEMKKGEITKKDQLSSGVLPRL